MACELFLTADPPAFELDPEFVACPEVPLIVALDSTAGVSPTEGLVSAEVVALTEGLACVSALVCSPCADAEPQIDFRVIWAARACPPKEGAITGAESKNRPAPAATAACPARTTLTGNAALRW